jgi:glyoxylase-like metal-dependent hydrolase (beta-lactamase superfamily II)
MVVILAAICALAQQQPAPVEVVPVRGSAHLIRGGSGANAGLIVAAREAIVIDAKMTEDTARAMFEAIRKVTPHPVRRVILTHSDGDHINGLAGFPKEVTVIAHTNARRDIEQAAKDPKFGFLTSWIPQELVSGDKRLDVEGVRVELRHFGPAHTDGDLVVWLPAERVAYVGDLLFIGRDPLIHRHKNGNSVGLVSTLKKLVELEADTYVSGHAEPVGKDEIRKLIASLEATQEKVRSLMAQGRSLDEIKAAFGVTGAPTTPGRRPGLVEVIYLELTEKK